MDKIMQQSNNANTVFHTEWFSIDAVPGESLGRKPYYRLSCDDSVEILAVTLDRKIVLVRQFRPAVGMSMLELPAGYVDWGESPDEAVRRELREETGYVCDSVINLGPFKVAPSRINNTLYLFFGRDAELLAGKDNEADSPEVVLVTLEEFKRLIGEGKFLEVAGIATYCLSQMEGQI
ncbi:MAG: NUDIX hydrolase [Deltaproteobacteria bacterium]|nr:NUDIX hydrolase [Deltaproteobacteria bacterium]MBL7224526.1 NUDIX hydrolase [Desulfobacteraceae bacterium]